ncbi:hypothetical protein [Streptacidiphilus melanogenes]|uniref:hypothetical protein n=1 Tax=Streptacidiphilus melanogenes TaxID=411235 RepID=UPI0005AA1FED|nr:hypothetical protein [Streptacidiphilus melanogenes]
MEELARELARASVIRLAGAGQLVLMTDAQLSAARGKAAAEVVATQRALNRVRDLRDADRPVDDALVARSLLVQQTSDELLRVTVELQRRIRMDQRQRAAEAAVRRALVDALLLAATQNVQAAQQLEGQASGSARARRHAEAEAQLQQHRPETAAGYGVGMRR